METVNNCLHTQQEAAELHNELITDYNSNFIRKQTISRANTVDNQTVRLFIVPLCFERTPAQSPSKLAHMVNILT
jgi:hypothetical protein